jgi:SAM-dependent methyltransferase
MSNPSVVEHRTRPSPGSLLPSLQGIPFVCPLCHGSLAVWAEAYHCTPCGRAYPLHEGIPDFRVFPDPFLSFEEDRRRTELVLAALGRYDLKGLLEYYWSFSDITPPLLRVRFVRSALLGEKRARRVLSLLGTVSTRTGGAVRRVLEIGSGTGNFLAVARPYEQIIGIDIAMRWLHLSRQRFLDKDLPVPALVCCCAEHLPFPDRWFDLAVCNATLEFTQNPEQVLSESARTLGKSGCLYISTVNRFSITQDPYSALWGVGLLPRSWQARYVRWRRNANYENTRLLSLRELHALGSRHFAEVQVALPAIDGELLQGLPWRTRLQGAVYQRLSKLPLFEPIFKWIAPQWDVLLCKGHRERTLH